MIKHSILIVLALAPAIALPACTRAPQPPHAPRADSARTGETPPASDATAVAAPPTRALPLAVVHKSPTCGCCGAWVEHLRRAGFQVEVREEDNLEPIKQRLGVPYGKGSCHTAEIGGYVIEGHVPAEDIKRLLVEKPDARGLVLPGMPLGSPGMEVPDGTVQPFTVELVRRDGTTVAYAAHGP